MRTWETHFPIPDWLLDVFHIPHGLIAHIEIYLSAYEVHREENALYFEIAFLRQEDNVWPHRVEQIIFMVAFSWPNHFYQEDPSRIACTPSHVTVVLDEMFDTADNREGSALPGTQQLITWLPISFTSSPSINSWTGIRFRIGTRRTSSSSITNLHLSAFKHIRCSTNFTQNSIRILIKSLFMREESHSKTFET